MIFIACLSTIQSSQSGNKQANCPPHGNTEEAYARAAEVIPAEWAGLDLAVDRIRNSATLGFAALLEAPITLLRAASRQRK